MDRDLRALIKEMTLEEKVSLCSGLDFWHTKGIERLGIPSIMMTDGPHGLRKQKGDSDPVGLNDSVPATCFPSAVGLASTWNRELIEKVGVALGEECQAEDVAILLGPGVNIKRSPLCGRNFEYFSEDPYLSSQMAASHIKGVQSQGVGTSLKHFAVNNQEHRRMTVDAQVDERALREIYLASFEAAVKDAKPWTVMASYNKVNGTYASENPKLLTDILRNEWGFDGFVVSDWGAVNERVPSLEAGLELEMPSSSGLGNQKIMKAIHNGELSEETLDQAVERLLTIIYKAVDNKKDRSTYDKEAHHVLAREVAAESMVLLKNDDTILPLKTEGPLAVIGELAVNPRYQGGGSSHIQPTKLDNSFDEIQKRVGKPNVTYARGYDLERDEVDPALLEEASDVAAKAEVVVLFVGLPDRYESEGYDRSHLRLPEAHLQLIQKVTSVNDQVVVVLSNGSPVEMPWLHRVKGLLEAYLGGQASGSAIACLLFGDRNPSGKLAETFPIQLEHTPSFLNFPGEGDVVDYKEGLFVGYRYYDTKGITPLFPFGYGLSYTQFDYSNLRLSARELKEGEPLTITVTVTNSGHVSGKESVQLYIQDVEATVRRPQKELKGFEKVSLEPGESADITFTVGQRAFAFYSVEEKDWKVKTGRFNLLIGRSSAEIVLSDSVQVTANKQQTLKQVTRTTTVGDLLRDPIVGPLTKQMMQQFAASSPIPLPDVDPDAQPTDMMGAMMSYFPLRAVVNFSQGQLSEELLDLLIAQLNGALANS